MRVIGRFDREFEDKWRQTLREAARLLGLQALSLKRTDLAQSSSGDGRRLRLAIWVRGRQVGELLAVSSRPLTLSESPNEVHALFAMREAIEADLDQTAAVA